MTEKLYWNNSYATEFTAKVILITEEGLILDKTLFYPTSGNQASDQGILEYKKDKIKVYSVEIVDEGILHHIPSEFISNFKIGDVVTGKVDWNHRLGVMKAHTSQHIFSAVLFELFDAKTERATIEFEKVSIQIDLEINEDQLFQALKRVNEICILVNKVISTQIHKSRELENLKPQIRSEIPEKHEIRLVKIDDLDLVCCGGTHVKQSTDIGPVILTEFKKGTNIKYFVGKKAIDLNSSLNVSNLEFSNELNTSIFELKQKIHSTLMESESIKELIEQLKFENLYLLSNSPDLIYKNFELFISNYQLDNKTLKRSIENFSSNSIIVFKLSDKRYQVVSKSEKIKADKIIQFLINKFGGKGGGSNFTAQAQLENIPNNLKFELKQFIDKLEKE